MLEHGREITIGGKYAMEMSYNHKVGRKAIIRNGPTPCQPNGYTSKGEYMSVELVDRERGDSWLALWDIHTEDCMLVSIRKNIEAQQLLDKEY